MKKREESAEQNYKIPVKWQIIIIILIIFGVFIIPKIYNNAGENKIINCATTLVSNNLRAPSTAVFYEEKIVEKDKYGRYVVTMFIESENAFGGNIKKFAIVVLQKVNENGTFDYLSGNSVELVNPESIFLKDSIINNLKNVNSWNVPRS